MEKLEQNSSESPSSGASKEWAFVILDDCPVSLLGEHENGDNIDAGKWLDVEIQRSNSGDSEWEECCIRCEFALAVDPTTTPTRLLLSLDRVPFFNGELNLTQPPCACGRSARTEGSMFVGMLRACEPVVVIQSCKVFFRDDSRQRAALVFTLGFPYLTQRQPGSRSILPAESYKKSVILLPGVQAVLSIVRSDWQFLNKFTRGMEQMFQRNRLHSGTVSSLFPTKLTLDEMYRRVNGSRVIQEIQQSLDEHEKKQPNDSFLTQLSAEILRDNVAPYLRSPSLHALRSTCSYLHRSLETFVPGLKLKLYNHQIKSLRWMRTREAAALIEADLLRLEPSSPHSIDGDAHRAATGGLTTKLVLRGSPVWETTRVNQVTGNEVVVSNASALDRNVARGGLLCDDPGLGKTITVLSLILQTAGMKPSVSSGSPNNVDVDDDEELFQAYWHEQYVVPYLRHQALLKLFNSFIRSQRLPRQTPLLRIRNEIESGAYGVNFGAFEEVVRKYIREFYEDQGFVSELLVGFQDAVGEFKKTNCQVARKSFSNAAAKRNSKVAGMITKRLHTEFLRSLAPSNGTLLVVPSVLLDHWEEQIRMHVELSYLAVKQPLLFVFTGCEKSVATAWELIRDFKTHTPVLFIDRGGPKPLPPAEFLAEFQIVLTTNQRFINEWKNGSFQQEIHRESLGDSRPEYLDSTVSSTGEVCPLLKIYWHRMVVDEGHSMAKDRISSGIQFASWISSERRWAMTGTPTKRDGQIGQLKALFGFLRHDFFTSRCEGDMFWKKSVFQYWKKGCMVSFFRLRSLLQLVMKRHTKLDIEEIPSPVFRETVVPMSFIEVNTYNTLVAGVQLNLLLTSMEGRTSGKQDSLLHRNNAKHARDALVNIRRVCVGWSRVIPTLTEKTWRETMNLAQASLDEDAVQRIREYMHAAETEGLGQCSCCSMKLTTLLIMSCCGKLICTECMDSSTTSCLQCGEQFDVDELQRFQPGFHLIWKSNIKPKRTRASSALPATARNGDSSIDASQPPHGNENGEMNNIIRQEPPVRRRTQKYGDGHVCNFHDDEFGFCRDGRCILCHEKHKSCNMLNEGKRCQECGRRAEDCPEDSSKAYHICSRLLELNSTWRRSGQQRPLKVIVFSQFREAVNFVGDLLIRRFGTACIAEYWGKYRSEELGRFFKDAECFCLLLTKDGSEGLDLSFVTHIFFLEEIWDKALEDQAVARAWRMGAKGPVEVETLIAQNSVEEGIREVKMTSKERGDFEDETLRSLESMNKKEQERTKTQHLLSSLRFITDFHRFGGCKGDQLVENVIVTGKRKYPGHEKDEPRKKKTIRFAD